MIAQDGFVGEKRFTSNCDSNLSVECVTCRQVNVSLRGKTGFALSGTDIFSL